LAQACIGVGQQARRRALAADDQAVVEVHRAGDVHVGVLLALAQVDHQQVVVAECRLELLGLDDEGEVVERHGGSVAGSKTTTRPL
jgi:hypothetical protein